MYSLLRKALFCLDAERSHQLTLSLLASLHASPLAKLLQQSIKGQAVECMGLTFPHRLGLAAGLDKNGEYLDVFSAMGFAFIEVGTVTPKAQLGNDKPRLYRLPSAEAIINRMGFNNKGVDYLIEQIEKSHFQGKLGINIGKNKTTPIEYSQDDYLLCLEKVYRYADYITINISSPNTPDLRSLQYGEAFDQLLIAIKNKQQQLQQQHNKRVPIAVKIAPDLTTDELTQMAESFIRYQVDAVIATNTTLDNRLIQGIANSQQIGGISGRPLQNKSTQVIQLLSSLLQPHQIPIIGVGGINDLMSAREKLQAGASLLQIYSGLIYHGPKLIKTIAENLP